MNNPINTYQNKKDLPIITIILDKASCCYKKNDIIKGSIKITNIKRKINYLALFIKGYYIPSRDPKIHKMYPDVSKLCDSVIYEQENLMETNIVV